jgi:hypothetical protein
MSGGAEKAPPGAAGAGGAGGAVEYPRTLRDILLGMEHERLVAIHLDCIETGRMLNRQLDGAIDVIEGTLAQADALARELEAAGLPLTWEVAGVLLAPLQKWLDT